MHHLPSGETVFAGQRNDGFFVDLGAIFDLGDIRELQNLHLIPTAAATSVDPLKTLNIHTIAIKVPISMLTRDGSVPSDPMSAKAVLGIWGGASRRKVQVRDDHGNGTKGSGPWVQVSRLGNPLFNEVIVPIGDKDRWNARRPDRRRASFEKYVNQPELAKLLPVLYPGVFPNLAAYTEEPGGPPRDPAHRDPERDRPRVPELHRAEAGGHAAAERRDPADDRRTRTRSAWSAATSPASRTGGGCSTTSSRSS